MTSSKPSALADRVRNKGTDGEEAVLAYFRKAGYYCVRGCQYRWRDSDITDVDIFLYGKMSSLSRERINVDIKYKQRPQAAERVLVARGIQVALGLDRAIVVTTDEREWLREFAANCQVTLLGGAFLKRLASGYRTGTSDRLEFAHVVAQLRGLGEDRATKEFLAPYQSASGLLLTELGYPLCIMLIDVIGFYSDQVVMDPRRRSVALRLMYAALGMFCISLDFAMRESVLTGDSLLLQIDVSAGLRYGQGGKQKFDAQIETAMMLMSQFLADGRERSRELKTLVTQAMEAETFEGISRVLARSEVYRELFTLGRTFDGLAFAKDLKPCSHLGSLEKTLVGLFLDLSKTDRTRFFDETERVALGPKGDLAPQSSDLEAPHGAAVSDES